MVPHQEIRCPLRFHNLPFGVDYDHSSPSRVVLQQHPPPPALVTGCGYYRIAIRDALTGNFR